MNKTNLKNYISLCKKDDINLIHNIANDISNGRGILETSKKYNVTTKQVISVIEIDDHKNISLNNNILDEIFNKYQQKNSNKTGGFFNLNNFFKPTQETNETKPTQETNEIKPTNSESKKQESADSKSLSPSKIKNLLQTSFSKKQTNKEGSHMSTVTDSSKSSNSSKSSGSLKEINVNDNIDEIVEIIFENEYIYGLLDDFCTFFGNEQMFGLEKLSRYERKLFELVENRQNNTKIKKFMTDNYDELINSINEKNKEKIKNLFIIFFNNNVEFGNKFIPLILKIDSITRKKKFWNMFGGDNSIMCACCDCSKDGYIFTDEENQKCEK